MVSVRLTTRADVARQKHARHIGAVCLVALLLATSLPLGTKAQLTGQEVIVEVVAGVDPARVAREMGITPTFVYRDVINGFAGVLPAVSASAAQRNAAIVQIVPDLPVSLAAAQDGALRGRGGTPIERLR